MKYLAAALLLTLAFSACTNNYNKAICKQWKAHSMQSSYDKVKTEERIIEDMAANMDTTQNKISKDSLKKLAQEVLKQDKEAQQVAMHNLTYTFYPNGILLLTTGEGTDSVGWKIIEKNKLVIDESKVNGIGSELFFTILNLDAQQMTLSTIVELDTVITNFKPIQD